MKRSLKDIDDLIPSSVWNQYPEAKHKLLKIQEIENKIDQIQTNNRKQLINYSTPLIKRKVLRIFVNHKYVPTSDTEKAHFVINLEGYLLCPTSIHYSKIGTYFDRIRFQIEKKNIIEKQYEWNSSVNPECIPSDIFRVKIYGEKYNQNLKILLNRSNDPRPRYEISQKLRRMFPSMPFDVPEEEIMTAMWGYLVRNNLFIEGRDREKKLIKCDELLKDLLVTPNDTYVFAQLHGKVMDNLSLCKPIQIEYLLTNTSTQFVPGCYGPKELSKKFGRAFDVEVDVPDFSRFEAVHSVSRLIDHVHEAETTIAQMEPKLVYLTRLLRLQASELLTSASAPASAPCSDTTTKINNVDTNDSYNSSSNNNNKAAFSALSLPLPPVPPSQLAREVLARGYLDQVARGTDLASLIAARPMPAVAAAAAAANDNDNANTMHNTVKSTSAAPAATSESSIDEKPLHFPASATATTHVSGNGLHYNKTNNSLDSHLLPSSDTFSSAAAVAVDVKNHRVTFDMTATATSSSAVESNEEEATDDCDDNEDDNGDDEEDVDSEDVSERKIELDEAEEAAAVVVTDDIEIETREKGDDDDKEDDINVGNALSSSSATAYHHTDVATSETEVEAEAEAPEAMTETTSVPIAMDTEDSTVAVAGQADNLVEHSLENQVELQEQFTNATELMTFDEYFMDNQEDDNGDDDDDDDEEDDDDNDNDEGEEDVEEIRDSASNADQQPSLTPLQDSSRQSSTQQSSLPPQRVRVNRVTQLSAIHHLKHFIDIGSSS